MRAIVVDPQDRIALVRHHYLPGWYLPGGGVEKGESFEAAIWRELREEIAIADGEIERLLGAYHSRRESKDDHILVFAINVDAEAAAAMRAADPAELEDAAWFALDDLPADASPATIRRIAEYRDAVIGLGTW